MADNVLGVSSNSVKRGITQFKYELNYCGQLDQRSSDFEGLLGNKGKAKSGTLTLQVDKPARPITEGDFGTTDGAFNASDHVEDPVSFPVNGYFKTHAELTTFQETGEVTDYKFQFRDQDIISHANAIEAAAQRKLYPLVPFAVLADGAPTLDDVGLVLSQLKENGAPSGMFNFSAPQRIHSAITGNVSAYQNPAKAISDQYYSGYVTEANGAKWFGNEHSPLHTNGTANNGAFANGFTPLGAMNGATANGANQLVIDTIGTDGTITKGSIIKIAGVDNINQWSRTSSGQARTFAVLETQTSSSGGVTLTLSESIYDGSGANSKSATLQNVTALPADGAVVSILGKVSTSYRQAMGFYKDFAGFAMVELVKPHGNTSYEYLRREAYTMRYIQDYAFNDDKNIGRLDSLAGVTMFRGEFACRLWQEIA